MTKALIIGNGFNIALHEGRCPCIRKSDTNDKCTDLLDYKTITKNISKKIKDEIKAVKDNEKKSDNRKKALKYIEFCKDKEIHDIELMLKYLKEYIKWIKHHLEFKNIFFPTDLWKDVISKNTVEEVYNLLRHEFILYITDEKNHPKFYKVITKNKKFSTIIWNNLENFQRLFTTNYDLTLYWLFINNADANESRPLRFKDGFKNNSHKKHTKSNEKKIVNNISENFNFFSNNNNFNLIYLHGAIHILQDMVKNKIFKITRTDDDNKNIHQILKSIRDCFDRNGDKNNYDNILVFEPNSWDKLEVIFNNLYLLKCYDKITTIDDTIITYGIKFFDKTDDNSSPNDQHLWEKIIKSKAKKVFFGIHQKFSELEQKEYKNKLKEILDPMLNEDENSNKNKGVYIYSTEDIKITDEGFIENFNTSGKIIEICKPKNSKS